ncbi:MAG: GGDEF domain-containing protein [Lachnospiraceae bacterium]
MKVLVRQFRHLIEILNGKREISDVSKYRFLCYSIAFVHVCITIRFFSLNYTILYVYNFLSILFYLIIGTILPPKGKFYAIYLCAFCEILFHSTFSSLLAGWEWGYMIYTLALIPVAFYLAYSLPQFGRSMAKPFVFAFITMCIFVLTKIFCSYIDPIYTERKYDKNLTLAYNLNALVAFLMLIFFSILFTIEIRRNEIRLESQNELLKAASSKDPLTGLLNRRSMDKDLSAAIEAAGSKGRIFSVIIGDIDDFKKVNDTYGHNFGDEVLVNVADIITAHVPEDARVCRWGGEEILILIHDNAKATIPIAEKLRKEIAASVTKADNISLRITMTFGVAEYIPGLAVTKLISLADDNLYKGKKEGKNRVVA